MNEVIKRRNDEGFTLIELMIVIAVIGILAIVLVPKVGMVKTQAKSAGIDVNMRMVQSYVQSALNNATTTAVFSADLANAFPTSATGDNVLANPFTGTIGTVAWPAHGGAVEYYTNTYANKAAADAAFITANNPLPVSTGQGVIVITYFTDPNNAAKFDVVMYPHDQNGRVIVSKVVVVTP